MSESPIEWLYDFQQQRSGVSWNPIQGCTRVHEGCRHCYAWELHTRRHQAYQKGARLPEQYRLPFHAVRPLPERLHQPRTWRAPRRVFVNSMSDLFHEQVEAGYIRQVFRAMAEAPQHTFLVLTKRYQRMLEVIAPLAPLPHVWLGVSVVTEPIADQALPPVREARRRGWHTWVSYEPALGPVDWQPWLPHIEWLVAGGESGPQARPMHPAWALAARDACQQAGLPFFFKQWGEWLPAAELKPSEKLGKPTLYLSLEGARSDTRHDPAVPMVRVGRKRAGRALEGRLHQAYPITQGGSHGY